MPSPTASAAPACPMVLHRTPACPLPCSSSCWGSSRPLLPSAAVPSMPGEHPLMPDSPFSPRSIQGKATHRQVHPLLSFSSAPSIKLLSPTPACTPGVRCSPVPTRGPCLCDWEGLELRGAGWPRTLGCAVAGRAVPAPVLPGSPVLQGPLPRCLWAFASRAVAEGTRGSGDAVGRLAAVNSLSILQALPAAPR